MNIRIIEMVEKQKLTLSVDRDVVRRAKEMRINISEFTENLLDAFTFKKHLKDEDVYEKYANLFTSMLPLMRKFNFTIKVAEANMIDENGYLITWNAYLRTDGSIFDPHEYDVIEDIKKIDTVSFLSPERLLSDFMDKLSNVEERLERRSKSLEMAKKIVDAVSELLEGLDQD